MLTINHCSWHVSRINSYSSQDTRIQPGLLSHPQHTEEETEAERLGTLPEATQLVNRQSRWGLADAASLLATAHRASSAPQGPRASRFRLPSPSPAPGEARRPDL